MLLAITGKPHPMASNILNGMPSLKLVETIISLAEYNRGISSTKPKNLTLFSMYV